MPWHVPSRAFRWPDDSSNGRQRRPKREHALLASEVIATRKLATPQHGSASNTVTQLCMYNRSTSQTRSNVSMATAQRATASGMAARCPRACLRARLRRFSGAARRLAATRIPFVRASGKATPRAPSAVCFAETRPHSASLPAATACGLNRGRGTSTHSLCFQHHPGRPTANENAAIRCCLRTSHRERCNPQRDVGPQPPKPHSRDGTTALLVSGRGARLAWLPGATAVKSTQRPSSAPIPTASAGPRCGNRCRRCGARPLR